jgi:hypothetical protein
MNVCTDAIHHSHEECSRFLSSHGATHGQGTNYALDLINAAGSGDIDTVRKLTVITLLLFYICTILFYNIL